MAEQTETVRKDGASRNNPEEKHITDFSGKRLVLPRGTTLPPTGLPGEVFVKVNAAAIDQLFLFDQSVNNWITVGPA